MPQSETIAKLSSERIILNASRLRFLGRFLVCLLFFVGGIAVLRAGAVGAVTGWLGIVFFGMGTLGFAIPIINPKRFYLELTPAGYANGGLLGKTFYRWADITELRVSNVGRRDVVRVVLSSDWQSRSGWRWIGLGGSVMVDPTLHSTLEAEDLRQLMESFRQRAFEQARQSR